MNGEQEGSLTQGGRVPWWARFLVHLAVLVMTEEAFLAFLKRHGLTIDHNLQVVYRHD